MRLMRRYGCASYQEARVVRATVMESPVLKSGAIEMLQMIHDEQGYAVTVYEASESVHDEPSEEDPDGVVLYEWVRGRELDE
jgi:hypothetical protein